MNAGGGRQLQLQVLLDGVDGHRRGPLACAARGRPSDRHVQQNGRYVQPLRDDTQAGLRPTKPSTARRASSSDSVWQIRDLGRPQNLHPFGVNLANETCQGQARFLDPVDGDRTPEPRFPRQQHKPQSGALI